LNSCGDCGRAKNWPGARGGHQVVARAFRRGLGQHRRFDVDEALVVEEAAEGHRHLVAQHQVLLHLRAAQVDHAVGQAHVLGEVFLVELEGRRHGGVEHFDVVAEDLDLARGQVGFSVPAGRRRTLPVTFSTNSLRTSRRS
jgi:hypothetical protein